MARNLSTAWTKGKTTPNEIEAVKNLVLNSSAILGLLRQIVREKIEAQQRTEFSLSSYDNPSWAHKQAHHNGRMQALNEIDHLLNITGE
jgi:hypothetical protein